jgi:hypothetical protein
LDRCLAETCHIVPINQVLLQYRKVVRDLTGIIAANVMKEITTFIKRNPDIIRYRTQINEAIDSARAEFLDALAEEIITELRAKGYSVKLHVRFGSVDGAFIIAPLPGSELSHMQCDNIETIKRGVEIEAGISIVPQATIAQEVARQTLAEVKIEGRNLYRPLAAIYKKNKVLTPAMKKFLAMLKS